MIAAEVRNIEKRFHWFNHIPSNWEVMRLKNICNGKLQYGINIPANKYSDDGVRFLRTTDINEDGEVIPNGIYIPKKEVPENYILQKGDLLFSRSGTVGRCYLHDSEEEYCYAGFLVKFKPKNYLLSKLLYYTSLTKEFKYQIFSEAIESTISNFNGNKFAVLRVAFPSDEKELKRLIDYLDFKYAEVKKFIQSKHRFIELLKEQRQSIITNAVTKGIDDGVKMKETVLGEIPEDWEVRRLKFCLSEKLKYGANAAGDYYNPAWYRYIRITDFSSEGTLDENNKLSLAPEDGKDYELKDGDILLARSGATVGKSFQFKAVDRNEKCCYAGYLIKASPNEDLILSDFLYKYTLTSNYESWKGSILIKATIENISADKYANLLIPIPPVKEQKQIIEHIKTETSTLDIAISKAEREIELIKEYREAMIAEAVTGKKKF